MKKITLLLIFFIYSSVSFSQIYVHDFGSTTITNHPYNVVPGVIDGNLSNSSWSNSTSSWTSFAGNTGEAISLNNSSGNPVLSLTFDVASGFELDVTSFNFWRRRSNTGAQNWAMTINSIAVGNGTIPTTGASIGNTTVSNPISGLTGTITVEISLSGASGTGTFRLDDFSLFGTVSAPCPDNINFANIQFPNTSQTILQGATSNVVYAQVYEPSITDTQNSQGAGITAEIGYSTTDTNPSTWTNWLPAAYNTGYGGTSNDEYFAEVGSTLSPGTYYIASRFQLNSCDYIYGGTSGVWSSGNSLQLTVLADTVDFNNLQSPANGSINIGNPFNVYARAYEPGVTNDGDSPDDAATGLQVWIGYNTTNTNPNTWTNWVPASFNAQYGNDDEYVADIGSVIGAAGTYYYASRFQLNGSSYTYGGISPPSGGNTWDGTTYISGVLNVINPCSSIFFDDFSGTLSSWNNTAEWTTVSSELKHNVTGNSGQSYINSNIGIQNLDYGDYEWSFCLRNGNWDPSTNNNFSFILLSNQNDLISNTTGYSVGINQANSESDDLIKIYRSDSGTETPILSSTFDWEANDDVCIRVTRTSSGDWELFYDDGTGEVSAGSTNDTTYTSGSFIGAYFEFTSTRAGDLWIDDINICSNLITCGTTVTWDGTSWSPSTPDTSTNAILTSNYNTNIAGQTSFSACSLTLNSGIELTIAPNTYVEINNDVTNNGRINIQNQGSFVQIEDTAVYDDSGSSFPDAAIVDRETAHLDNWYEYTYWSSPVANETFGNALFQSSPYRRFGFNAANFRDSQYETFNDDTLINGAGVDDIDDNGDDWFLKSSGDIMTPGVGYAATHSISAFIFGPNNYVYTFRGILNNGDITVPIERNDAETGDNNWNLVGNPYPSAIDVDLFFAENNLALNPTDGKLTGTIYLWSQNTAPTSTANGNQQLNFSNSDYATINGTMETVGGDGLTPNRYIPSGQGFFVLYDDAATSATGSVIFKNSMRVSGNNDQFFRASSTNNPNKIWLRLTSDIGLNNQIGIGYVNGATSQNDGGFYDAKKTGAVMNSLAFYSVIPGDNNKFVIQGKAPSDLNVDEIIPLGFLTNIDVATIYTISIDNLEGDFLTNNTVYLKDNLNSTIHDLTASDYNFTSVVGEFNNRFEIVFNNASLSIDNNEITSNNLSIIELENDNIMFKVGQNFTIQSIQIFDTLGKEVYNFKGENSTETFNMKDLSSSLYIAKVTLNNGQTITKKAIKK